MLVETYTDPVCPWCYIGRRRLDQAMRDRPDVQFDLHWLPFELNPGIAEAGLDRAAYLAARFADAAQLEAMHEQISAIGVALGIHFRFDLIRRTPNTRASHALVAIAAESRKQTEAVDALFRAYFEEGQDIGDRAVLVSLGASAGLDARLVDAALQRRTHYAAIVDGERQAIEWGVSGVPTFIFERRYAVSGAQEPHVLVQVFDRLRAAA